MGPLLAALVIMKTIENWNSDKGREGAVSGTLRMCESGR